MLNPNLKTVFHKIISLTRFEGGHAESAIIHSGLQNTQQDDGKLPITANPILSIGCNTIQLEMFITDFHKGPGSECAFRAVGKLTSMRHFEFHPGNMENKTNIQLHSYGQNLNVV